MTDLNDSPAMQNLRKPISEYEREQHYFAQLVRASRRPLWRRWFGRK